MGRGLATGRLGYLTENTDDITNRCDEIRRLWDGKVGRKALRQAIREKFE